MMQKKQETEVLTSISRVYRAAKRELNNRLESHGFSYVDFLILMQVRDSPKSMVYLAKEVLMTQAGITAAIDRLEEKGLVKRERDKEDRRIINVQITERGVKATEEAIQVFNELAVDLVKDLSDEDKAKLVELLDKLLEKLMKGKINVEPDQR
ncbi:MAG: MarR family transcriptional regulator [Metallosphaera sp.]